MHKLNKIINLSLCSFACGPCMCDVFGEKEIKLTFVIDNQTKTFYINKEDLAKQGHLIRDDSVKVLEKNGEDQNDYIELKEIEISPEAGITYLDNICTYCKRLTKVEIPETVENVDPSAFWRCEGLQKIIVPRCLAGQVARWDLPYQTVVEFVPHFEGCSDADVSLQVYKASGELQTIPLIHPDKVTTEILSLPRDQKNTFVKIVIPEGVQCIEDGAFGRCANLSEISIPSTVTHIGSNAFYSCGLVCVEIPSGVTSIGDGTFYYCSQLRSVSLPSSVTSIGNGAFFSCTALTSINLSAVSVIGESAFSSCTKLTLIPMSHVRSIGKLAFFRCISLTELSLLEVTSIGDEAFSSCDNLTSIVLPKVISIGDRAFERCISLKSIALPSVTKMGKNVFLSCGLETLSLPIKFKNQDLSSIIGWDWKRVEISFPDEIISEK